MFQHEFMYSSGLSFNLKHYVVGSTRGNDISIHEKTTSHLPLPDVVIAMEMRFRGANVFSRHRTKKFNQGLQF